MGMLIPCVYEPLQKKKHQIYGLPTGDWQLLRQASCFIVTRIQCILVFLP